ncbi:hypothetical protein [Parasutterella muris]|uniref:hypothetical protein n=1 Tax=Parasutterella muris TaxID=2565572 RepID=UPI00203CF714|nr:hypothetical protein [Parasutterella muris]
MAQIDSLTISLGLDASKFKNETKSSKQKVAELKEEFEKVQKAGQNAADNLSSHFSKTAKQVEASAKRIKKEFKNVREGTIETTTQNLQVVYAHGRKTNPYLKGGAKKSLSRMHDDQSLARIKEYVDRVKGGYANFAGQNAEILAKARGVTTEYKKQRQQQLAQLQLFDDIQRKEKERKKLMAEIRQDQEAINKIRSVTPKYANRADYQKLEKRLLTNQKQLATKTAYIDDIKKTNEYQVGRLMAKHFGVRFLSEQEIAQARLVEENKKAGKPYTPLSKKIEEKIRGLGPVQNLQPGILGFKNEEAAKGFAVQSAIFLDNQKQSVRLQKQVEASQKNLAREQRQELRAQQLKTKEQEKQLRLLERQRYYLQRDIRHGLSDLLMYGGGAFLGDRVLRGSFDSVAKLQKMESQVDTWNLNTKDRRQFDVIADRILKSSPLLSRAEAIDATLAGMTSMGHFDPDSLKMVLPEAVKYAQGSKMLGYSSDTIANIIKNYFGVVEARQQTLDPSAMLKTFKTLWQVENVTGGKVTVKDFETILRNLGPGAPLMSDQGLLNLVAFAEQIKVAGHGGGGGAGAGISTVGNLIKMLQLTASGKPTSISAKKMMSELFNITPDGKLSRLMDMEVDGGATQGGITFVQAMSNMKNIAQQTMEILGGADKEIAKAGFKDKQGMWDDPVKTMGAMREAFLRGTYLDRNGKWDEKKARKFYRDDQIDSKNKTLKNVNVLDEQKAITSLIAQMGFQHRTTTAMATFMNPFFLKRSGYTIESAQKQMDPMEWFQQQYAKGNWNVASQEFTVAMTRLGESMKPIVADFADLTRSVSKFITEIAEFNESHPLLTSLNGMLAATVALAPAIGMVAMAFQRLNNVARGKMELKSLQEQEQKKNWRKAMDRSWGVTSNFGPISPEIESKRYFNSQIPTAYQEIDAFCSKVNGRIFKLYTSVSKIVTKIGGLFLRMLPMVGTALLAFDLGSIVASWFADIEVKIDGESKRIGNIIEEKLDKLKAKWKAHSIFQEEQDKANKATQKQHETVDLIENTKNLIGAYYGGEFTEALRTKVKNGESVSAVGLTGDDPQTSYIGANNESVQDIVDLLTKKGFLREDFNIQDINQQTVLKELIDALGKLERSNYDLKTEIAQANGKANWKYVKEDKDGYVQFEKTANFELGEKLGDMFSNYVAKNQKAVDNLLNGTIRSSFFNPAGNDKEYEYKNLLDYREKVLKFNAETDEQKEKKKAELARVDALIVEATKEEYEAFTELTKTVKDNEKALYAFSELLSELTSRQLQKTGLTSLMSDKVGTSMRVDGTLQESIKNGGGSMVAATSKLYFANNPHTVLDKNGKKAYKESPFADLATPKDKGTPPSYYVPQNVKFLNTLQAQIEEGKANTLSLLAGQGKKGMDYARAVVLQKLLNGGLSLSNKNPQDSPYLIDKKKGLSAENVDWNKKDPVTKKTLGELAQMKYLAEQFKLAENAASKFAQNSAKAEEDFEAAAELVANGGVEKLPSSILTLNKEVAKVLSQLDKNSPIYKEIEKSANHAKAMTALAEVAKDTSSRMIELKNLKGEEEAYGLSSTQASWKKYQTERAQEEDKHNLLISSLEKEAANLTGEDLSKVQEKIRTSKETFVQYMDALDKKWLRDNETTGQSLVRQWTDLSSALDNIQSEMMSGFIDMTEEMLDGNLDSWRDYAYNLLTLIRRQILQGTFAPLLSMISGTINKGIATLLGDTNEVNRQDASLQNSGNVAVGMLGNGFYSAFGGKAIQDLILSKNKSKATTGVDSNGIETSYTGSIDDGTSSLLVTAASGEEQSTWWDSFTTSFSEGCGSLWNSTKEIFSWMGNGISSLADGFMELCGSPIEWLKNAFSSAANVIVEFIASLSANSSAKAVTGIITSVIGAVGGAVGGSSGAFANGSAGATGVSMGSTAGVGIKVPDASSWGWQPSSFANGGIMTSNGEIDLRKYASGGVANSPQLALFGEGSMPEAFVPLPDGRSIPVSFRNNSGVSETAGGNQISIVINVNNTSTTSSSESSSTDATQASKDASDMTKLANRIKAIVKQEIVVQSRPGGLLAQS